MTSEFRKKGFGWTFKFGSCWHKMTFKAMRLKDLTKEKYKQKEQECQGLQH